MTDTTTGAPTITIPVNEQTLRDLLCTAVEGGSNYWATFSKAKRTPDLDYLRVHVREHEPHSVLPPLNRDVTALDLRLGLERLGSAPFETALRHLSDALNENHDATTADVVLQMTVFGDVIYG